METRKMINTDKLLMVRLKWPPPPQGADPKSVRHWKKILSAGRRCLMENAPVTLRDTGFQLLKRVDEPEMRACLDKVLAEIGFDTRAVLVQLPAPVWDEDSAPVYLNSVRDMLGELADELLMVADRLEGKAVRVDSFNKAFSLVDVVLSLVKNDELVKLHAILVKLEQFDFEDDNAKGLRLLGKLADRFRRVAL